MSIATMECRFCGECVALARPTDVDVEAWEELSWEHKPTCWWVLNNGPEPPRFTHARLNGERYALTTAQREALDRD